MVSGVSVRVSIAISVFGAIAVCLFPLWPPEVRLGVYYLSVAAACFVGLIFILCIGTFLTLLSVLIEVLFVNEERTLIFAFCYCVL